MRAIDKERERADGGKGRENEWERARGREEGSKGIYTWRFQKEKKKSKTEVGREKVDTWMDGRIDRCISN